MDQGDLAPDFELADETGTPRRLSALLESGPVTLFFYPAAMTYGAPRRAATSATWPRVRRSRCPTHRHRRGHRGQAEEVLRKALVRLPPALGSGQVRGRRLRVARGLKLGPVQRATFVIDTDRTVIGVIHSEINMNKHADHTLEILRRHAGTAR